MGSNLYCILVGTLLLLAAHQTIAQPLLSEDPVTIDPIGCVTDANQDFCTSLAPVATNTTSGQTGGIDPDVVCPTASITEQNLSPEQVAAQVPASCSFFNRLAFKHCVLPPPRPQITTCVNAVRVNPDAFACLFPCNYNNWRADVVWPPRQALDVSPVGVQQLSRYDTWKNKRGTGGVGNWKKGKWKTRRHKNACKAHTKSM